MINEKTQQRVDALFELGLRLNGSEYVHEDFNVHWTEITCDTDKEFDAKLESIKKEMLKRKGLNYKKVEKVT